ncbi:MAG: hypothetical protein GXX90_10390, partial [Microbacteriaceae bacterium]|nr:hypothetical protein [Microbacteriaceae bacterium]
ALVAAVLFSVGGPTGLLVSATLSTAAFVLTMVLRARASTATVREMPAGSKPTPVDP